MGSRHRSNLGAYRRHTARGGKPCLNPYPSLWLTGLSSWTAKRWRPHTHIPTPCGAVQWRNGVGHVEFDDGRPNLEFMAEGDDVGDTYREYVLPGIRAFERERKRLDAEAEAASGPACRVQWHGGPLRTCARRTGRKVGGLCMARRTPPRPARQLRGNDAHGRRISELAGVQAGAPRFAATAGLPMEGPDDPVCPWPAEPANVCAPVPHSYDAEGALQTQVSE